MTDRVWFKVKVVNLRGAATQLTPSDTTGAEILAAADSWWWLGAAGERKEDSSTDFYKTCSSWTDEGRLAARARRGNGR